MSIASAPPIKPQPKRNMKSGVTAICSTSEVVAHVAGMRTLPSPRIRASSIILKNVIATPPKTTRAKAVAPSWTAPLAPITVNNGATPNHATTPKPRPSTTASTRAWPPRVAASSRAPAPWARATADVAPAPMPPPIAVIASNETGNTSDTAPIASVPRRLTKYV